MKKHIIFIVSLHFFFLITLQSQVWTEVFDLGYMGGQLGGLHMVNPNVIWGVSGTTVAVTYDSGETWQVKEVPDFGDDTYYNLSVYFINEQKGFVRRTGNDKIVLLQTEDGGETWTKNKEWSTNRPKPIFPTAMIFFDENIGLLICTYGIIYRTLDGGNVWELANSPIALEPISLLAIEIIDEHDAWIVGRGGVVLKTTDKGENWNRIEIHADSATLNALSFPSPQVGYIMGPDGLMFKTLDSGDTWDRISGRYYQHNVHFLDENRGLIGALSMNYTLDGGQTWHVINMAPETYHVIDVVAAKSGQAFALANGGGIYKADDFLYPEKTLSGIESLNIYPNPASDFLTLEGGILGCELKLIDSNGKVLLEKDLLAEKVEIPLSDFSIGIYFLEFSNGQSKIIRKIFKI